VPQFQVKKLQAIWQPILKYLHEETGHEFKMMTTTNIPAFESELLAGKFDFSYINPYQMTLASPQGYTPIVRDNGRKLFGVLTVRKNGEIKTIKDLDGKIIAFPAPNALGASMLIRRELTDKFAITFTPRYVKTHDSVYLNILINKASAGGGVQKTFNRQNDLIKDRLNIILKTEAVSPHPIAAHPRVPEEVVQAVKQALLQLGKTEKGRNILSKVPMKKIGEAEISDYAELKSMKLERFYKKNN